MIFMRITAAVLHAADAPYAIEPTLPAER